MILNVSQRNDVGSERKEERTLFSGRLSSSTQVGEGSIGLIETQEFEVGVSTMTHWVLSQLMNADGSISRVNATKKSGESVLTRLEQDPSPRRTRLSESNYSRPSEEA